jgi:hypothetical protein
MTGRKSILIYVWDIIYNFLFLFFLNLLQFINKRKGKLKLMKETIYYQLSTSGSLSTQ